MSSDGVAGIGKRMSSPGRPGLPRRFVCLSPIIPNLRAIEYGGWHPPAGCGGPRPQAEVHRHGEGAPGPRGWGRTKLSGEEEWRHTQTAGSKRGWAEGIVGGRGLQPETQVQVGGLCDVGEASSRPLPQLPAFRSQSISWQRKKRAEGQKAGEIGRRRGAQRKGPWEGEGSYANGRIDRIPGPLIKAPEAAAGITGVEERKALSSLGREAALRGKQGAPKKRSPCPLHTGNSSDGGHGGKAKTPAAIVCVEAIGGSEQVGPCPWDSQGPTSFVRAS